MFAFLFLPLQHAEEDKKRKASIDALNAAESIIHDTEKNLEEFKSDLEGDGEAKVREKIKELREYISQDKETIDPEEVRKLSGAVQQESLKAFDVAYKKVSWLTFGARLFFFFFFCRKAGGRKLGESLGKLIFFFLADAHGLLSVFPTK